jgi:hypothetical protein
MKKLHKEGIYFVLTLLISLIAFVLLFGIENIKSGDLVLNVHSTYFVIKATHFLIIFLPLFFSIIYLIRIAVLKFKNLYSNLIYIVSNGSLIFIILSIVLNNLNPGFKANLNLWLTLLVLLILEILIIIKTMKLKKHCA